MATSENQSSPATKIQSTKTEIVTPTNATVDDKKIVANVVAKFIPTESQYLKKEFIKSDDGTITVVTEKATGIETKVFLLSEPQVPQGMTIDPDYVKQYHRVSYLNGKRVKYQIFATDNEKLLKTVDVSVDC